jgi:hypothetical protein
MPLLSTLERFIARVEHNKHVEAIEEFYTIDASMQENSEPPRVGRDVLIEHERVAMTRLTPIQSICVRPVFQHDEFVVIRWIFEFEGKNGSNIRIEELAYQRWEGEHIAQEQFFYDPKQFLALSAAS